MMRSASHQPAPHGAKAAEVYGIVGYLLSFVFFSEEKFPPRLQVRLFLPLAPAALPSLKMMMEDKFVPKCAVHHVLFSPATPPLQSCGWSGRTRPTLSFTA